MATRPLPSQEVLRQLLDYDPETGTLTWRARQVEMFQPSATRSQEHVAALWNARYAGAEAFTSIDAYGYRCGAILGVGRKAHRIIWKMMHGSEPDQIDHINGLRSDNRLLNLREASQTENSRNTKIRANNYSGVVGVKWDKRRFKWLAEIKVSGRAHLLGAFDLFWDAVAARKEAEARMGFHENHGRD